MTAAALTPSKEYIENGVTLAYAVPFRFRAATHIKAQRISAAGVVTELAYGTDYSVTGGETDAGGTLTVSVAGVAGTRLRIRRETPRAQDMDYTTGDTFPAESHEAALDKAILIDQEQDQKIDDIATRALLVPDGETAGDLPNVVEREGRLLAFGPSGLPLPGPRSDVLSAVIAAVLGGVSIGKISSVVSVAAMTALAKSGLVDGDTISVLGYYGSGDLGGGLFRWEQGSATPVDECTVFAADEGGNGRWKRLIRWPMNLHMFGAVGDGVANDTNALQRCATWFNAQGGGVLHIPRGTYNSHDHFAFSTGNLHIFGDGIGLSTIKVFAWIDGLRISDGYPAASSVVENILIENLSVDGNRSGYANGPNDTYGNGININACDKVLIQNVEVYNHAEQGIVSTYWQAGGNVCDHIIIDRAIVRAGQSGRIQIGIEGRGRASRVTNCTVKENKGVGIYVGHVSGAGVDNGEVIITTNRVECTGDAGAIGILAEDFVYNNVISSNLILKPDIGIRCSSNTGPTSGYQVNGNTIIDWISFGILTFPPSGSDSINSQIVSNRLRKSGVSGVAIAAGKGSVVQSNWAHGGQIGIEAAGDNVVILANHVTGTSSYSIRDANKAGCVIAHNVADQDIDVTNVNTQIAGNLGFATQRWNRSNLGGKISTIGIPTTAGAAGSGNVFNDSGVLKVAP